MYQEVGRRAAELVEVNDEEEQFGADERRDDDVDTQVEHPVGVEAPTPRPLHGQPKSKQIRRREQDTVRVYRDRSETKQFWIHRSS
jgi:hypothetical protein